MNTRQGGFSVIIDCLLTALIARGATLARQEEHLKHEERNMNGM